MKCLCANRIAPDKRRVLRRHIWGYAVCLCPTKRTPDLNELIQVKFPYSTTQHQSTYITLMIGEYIRFIQNDCENIDPEFFNDVDNGCRKGEHLKSRIMTKRIFAYTFAITKATQSR